MEKSFFSLHFHYFFKLCNFKDVTVDEFNLDLIKLDNDVVSMEMPLCFKQFFLVRAFDFYFHCCYLVGL